MKRNVGTVSRGIRCPIIREIIELSDAKAVSAKIQDGREVKLHTLGVQIQGADFAVCDENGEWNSGVVLKNGTKLQFKPGVAAQDYYAEEMQWNICLLSRVIEPAEVAAIFVGDTIYPIK